MSDEQKDDGGAAFPLADDYVQWGPDREDNMRITAKDPHAGMSLRDYFAAKALPSALALEVELRRSQITQPPFRFDVVARSAGLVESYGTRERVSSGNLNTVWRLALPAKREAA